MTKPQLIMLCKENWSIEGCSSSIGSSTELSFLGIIDFEEEIYINVASATTCGGYLRNVSYCAIKRGTGAPFNNGIIFLMEPSGNNRYEVVCYYNFPPAHLVLPHINYAVGSVINV